MAGVVKSGVVDDKYVRSSAVSIMHGCVWTDKVPVSFETGQ
jgi:hypothetical protein